MPRTRTGRRGSRRGKRASSSRKTKGRRLQRIQRSLHPRLDFAKFIVRSPCCLLSAGGSAVISTLTSVNDLVQSPTTGGSGTSIVAGVDKVYFFAFNLADIPTTHLNYYTALWDQIKLCGVRFCAMPRITESLGVVGLSEDWYMTGVDYDGDYPTTLDRMQDWSRAKKVNFAHKHPIKRFIRGRVLQPVTDGTNTQNISVRAPWICTSGGNMSGSTLYHFGLVIGIPGCSPQYVDSVSTSTSGTQYTQGQAQTWDIECTYYVAFRERTG